MTSGRHRRERERERERERKGEKAAKNAPRRFEIHQRIRGIIPRDYICSNTHQKGIVVRKWVTLGNALDI